MGDGELKIIDKKLLKRMEEIEALPGKEKEKNIRVIDLIIRDMKIKKAHPVKIKSLVINRIWMWT